MLDFSKYSNLLLSILILIGALSAGFILHAITIFILNRHSIRKKTSFNGIELKLEHLKGPLGSLIPAICIGIVLPFLEITPEFSNILNHLIYLWIIASIIWLSIRIIYITRDVVLGHYQINVKDNLQARRMYTQIRVIVRILTVIILIIGLSIMLMSFSKVRQVGISILASAGIIGIILGFAAQRTLGNLLAGIQIAIAQPIRIDEVVIVGLV